MEVNAIFFFCSTTIICHGTFTRLFCVLFYVVADARMSTAIVSDCITLSVNVNVDDTVSIHASDTIAVAVFITTTDYWLYSKTYL